MNHFVPQTIKPYLKKTIPFFSLVLSLCIENLNVQAQCSPAAPAVGTCAGGNGAASSNLNINSGQTYWFSAGPSTLGNVNFGGGTLRVCGTLTLSNPNFNSGTIIVESGGSLTINGGGDWNLNGNTNIVNRGNLTINKNVRLQNSNNNIWNEGSTSNLTINGNFDLNSSTSKLQNKGNFTANNITIQSASAGAICITDNSTITTGSLNNNTANAISYSGSGSPSCLRFTGNAQLNSNLTNSSSLKVCRATGSTTSGGAGWGSAVVTNNCNSCMTLLPVRLEYFTVAYSSNLVKLSWKSSEDVTNEIFVVERSADAVHFETITQLRSQRGVSVYSAYDATPISGKSYYRLKQVDPDGTPTYSETIFVKTDVSNEPSVSVYPNPVLAGSSINLSITAAKKENISLQITDMNGRIVSNSIKQVNAGYNSWSLSINQLAPGNYFVQCKGQSLGNIYKKITVTH